jgi:hypothetical protein
VLLHFTKFASTGNPMLAGWPHLDNPNIDIWESGACAGHDSNICDALKSHWKYSCGHEIEMLCLERLNEGQEFGSA